MSARSIGDATVSAGHDVLVNAMASKAIDSTAVSAAASAIALSAGVSVYSIGNGVDPNGKASDELKTSDSSGSVTNFAGNSLSVGGKSRLDRDQHHIRFEQQELRFFDRNGQRQQRQRHARMPSSAQSTYPAI